MWCAQSVTMMIEQSSNERNEHMKQGPVHCNGMLLLILKSFPLNQCLVLSSAKILHNWQFDINSIQDDFENHSLLAFVITGCNCY